MEISMEVLLSPPIAFLVYIPLVTLIALLGRKLASRSVTSEIKTSLYHSGEEAPTKFASPGYKPFFLVALFFAILHLGILVLGIGDLSITEETYLIGLMIALIALILG
jgi:NADH:ubiquinone oxidoreductase subunit 3 (subunit A)